MRSLFVQLFDTSGFMPHGHCYLWKPALVWSMGGSDLLIAISYLVISLILWIMVKRIRLPFSGVFVGFGLFILACGAGHFLDFITLWRPIYWVSASVRIITAVASIATAIWLIPVSKKVRLLAQQTKNAHLLAQELIRADEKLKHAYADLEKRVQERTAEYQELVDTVDGIVWESNVGEPGYTLVSLQAERLLGYPIDRWLKEPRFWQSILHPDDRARMTGKSYLPIDAKHDCQREYRVTTAAGKTLWMKDYVRVIYENGKPAKMRGIMVDITVRKRAEEGLREAQAARIHAACVKEQFLANMSHEIRTPLNAIVGMAAIGISSSQEDERKECLTTIKTAADSLLLIVNDLLDFSKIEAGKMELEFSDFKLKAVCRNAVEVITPLARAKGIDIGAEVSPNLPDDLNGDAGRLLQVLMNLLSNATKFTKSGGSVNLRVHENNKRLRFEIIDTGAGIPEEVKEKLFLPFSQGDPSMARKYGGTGLGLSICKRLVTLMNGDIGMESAVGKGSTFWFEVPLILAKEPVQPTEDSASDLEQGSESPLRILVVDDNFANQKVVTRMLEKLGHWTDAVGNGEEAVTSYQRGKYDLILMDCQMPEMDGYEATRRIRQIEAASGKRIPIVALTAHALSGDRKKCEDSGMDDYISKPVDIRQLRKVLSRKKVEPDHSASPNQDGLPSVDHNRLKELETLQSPGKPDIICELVDYFLAAAPSALSEIQEAFKRNDGDVVEKQAHKLKSTCHNVGAKRLAILCETAELQKLKCPTDIIDSLPQEYERASGELRELISRRKAS